MKNKRPGIKTKRNKKIVVQDRVPALFESLVAADGGATPFAIVKIESYDPATQQYKVTPIMKADGVKESTLYTAIALSPVPESYLTGARMEVRTEEQPGQQQTAFAIYMQGIYYIIGYVAMPSLAGYRRKETNEPTTKPGDIKLKHTTRSTLDFTSEPFTNSPTLRNSLVNLFVDPSLKLKFDKYRNKLSGMLGNVDIDYHGGKFTWYRHLLSENFYTQAIWKIDKEPEYSSTSDYRSANDFDQIEKHNEDIVFPLSNPTMQNYVPKLLIRAGQQNSNRNTNTWLLEMQTRQASGGAKSAEFMDPFTTIAPGEMVKDYFTRTRLGWDKSSGRMYILDTKQYTDKGTMMDDPLYASSSFQMGQKSSDKTLVHFNTLQTVEDGEKEKTFLDLGKNSSGGWLYRQHTEETVELTTTDVRRGLHSDDSSVSVIKLNQNDGEFEYRQILGNTSDGQSQEYIDHLPGNGDPLFQSSDIIKEGMRNTLQKSSNGDLNMEETFGVGSASEYDSALSGEYVHVIEDVPNTYKESTTIAQGTKTQNLTNAVITKDIVEDAEGNYNTNIVSAASEEILEVTADGTRTHKFGAGGSEFKLEILNDGQVTLDIGEGSNTLIIKPDGAVSFDNASTLDITSAGQTTIKSDAGIDLEGGAAMTEIDGVAPPNSKGAFCALPVCAFSGAPHTGSQAMKNKVSIK